MRHPEATGTSAIGVRPINKLKLTPAREALLRKLFQSEGVELVRGAEKTTSRSLAAYGLIKVDRADQARITPAGEEALAMFDCGEW